MWPKPFIFFLLFLQLGWAPSGIPWRKTCVSTVSERASHTGLRPSQMALKKIPIVAGQCVTCAKHFRTTRLHGPKCTKSGGPTVKTIDVSVCAPDVAGILRRRAAGSRHSCAILGKYAKGFACKRAIWWAGRQSSMRTPERPKGYIDNRNG